jgi:hypothetical protein
VIRFADIEKRLDQQHNEDARQLRKNYSEQNKLRPSVIRFNDLEREAKAREDRMARVVMLLGEDKFEDTRRELLKGKDVSKEIVTMTDEKTPAMGSNEGHHGTSNGPSSCRPARRTGIFHDKGFSPSN